MDSSAMSHSNGFNFNIPPPPKVDQPPQIFGNFSFDGSSLPPSLPGAFLGEDGNVLLGEELLDQNDPKRRRIARACDMCRKKKIKCDGKQPACSHCQNYKTDCVFTQVEKKRNPPKGAKYIEGLENRLGRMESLLRLSGLLSQDDDGKTDLGTLESKLAYKVHGSSTEGSSKQSDREASVSVREDSVSAHEFSHRTNATSPQSTVSQEQASAKKSEEEVEALSDMMCSLVTNNHGETKYIGSSSGYSIFSPKGIQWVNEKTGDSSFQQMISSAALHDSKWHSWKPEVFGDIFARRVFRPLPPKEEALSLLKDYFENFNCMFPLFHEPTFMHLVDRQYSRHPYEGSGWWASLNVALAIAHRLRVMSNLVPQEEDEKGWAYLKNALAVQSELTIKNTDLLSVQALLGMASFLLGTPNPQPSFFLVAAAIRLAHSIGLHKRGSGFNLNPVENEQRKRVFWIAYMLDKDTCIRSGRPPMQDDNDMNVELPSEDPSDGIGNIPLADGKGKINLFRLICTFAVIEGKVYNQLYSVKASKQSDGELLNTIGKLDNDLEEWKNEIPLDFRPEHEIKASHTPLMLHVVVLHFSYYNCLMTIHRMSIHHGYWTSRLSNFAIKGLNARPLNPRVFSSAALCVQAARASIHLIKYIPQGDFPCVWMIIYFPVSALVTIFANVLQNPQDTRARSDLKLMNLVVNFLSMLCQDGENGSVMKMLSVCTEFERVAKLVLDKSEKDSSNRRKRKPYEEKSRHQSLSATNTTSLLSPEQQAARRLSAGQLAAATTAANGISSQNAVQTPQQSELSSMTTPNSNTSYSSPASHAASQHSRTNSVQRAWLPDYSSPLNSSTTYVDTNPVHRPFATTNITNPVIPDITEANTALSKDPLFADSFNPNSTFQQPFVPQDLWQMPMTIEWDWAQMTGIGACNTDSSASMNTYDAIGGGGIVGVEDLNNAGYVADHSSAHDIINGGGGGIGSMATYAAGAGMAAQSNQRDGKSTS